MSCEQIEQRKAQLQAEFIRLAKKVAVQHDQIELLNEIEDELESMQGQATQAAVLSAVNGVANFILGVYSLINSRKIAETLLKGKLWKIIHT